MYALEVVGHACAPTMDKSSLATCMHWKLLGLYVPNNGQVLSCNMHALEVVGHICAPKWANDLLQYASIGSCLASMCAQDDKSECIPRCWVSLP